MLKLLIGKWIPTLVSAKLGIGKPIQVGYDYVFSVSIVQPGYYWIVLEELTNVSGTYVEAYINGVFMGEFYSPSVYATTLFGQAGPYEYNLVGTGLDGRWETVAGSRLTVP